nr:MAG: internal scaffolding protein [Microvirus sp.]
MSSNKSFKSSVFRVPYSNRSTIQGFVFTQDSLTKQSHKDEVDILNVMRRYTTSGLPLPTASEASFVDLVGAGDYLTSLNKINEAKEAFLGLSSSIRDKFNNDPALFLNFVHDPKNKDELVKLGLSKKPIVESIIKDSENKNEPN